MALHSYLVISVISTETNTAIFRNLEERFILPLEPILRTWHAISPIEWSKGTSLSPWPLQLGQEAAYTSESLRTPNMGISADVCCRAVWLLIAESICASMFMCWQAAGNRRGEREGEYSRRYPHQSPGLNDPMSSTICVLSDRERLCN